MNRTLIRTALAAAAFALSLPVLAQQAPVSPNAPNPSAPPPEGQKPDRSGLPAASDKMSRGGQTSHDQMTGDTSNMDGSQSKHHNKSMNKRSSKPRQKDAAPAPSAEAPSGPKGDSPDPVTKQ